MVDGMCACPRVCPHVCPHVVSLCYVCVRMSYVPGKLESTQLRK